ncbi:hypothetical protein [Crateriforma conspicua]|uniref:Tetratricopeptide repeat protein n=1 Tax=Crateriforma conspicua TaxID=2527996 RepID=A0A5C6FTA4_9PLAN|nr:hypothetical protein [Crateriforma conspicua]TWU65546.1 hypothetical protein V7x_10940 [Crateriforma conspicua]
MIDEKHHRQPLRCTVLFVFLWLSAMGCQSPTVDVADTDSSLVRYAKSGREAFAEGNTDAAIQQYYRAIARAWMLDDPAEAGTHAYNLAACFASLGRYPEAKDWLVDSRVELCRAGLSTGNTYLLQAKIAQDEGDLATAADLIQNAACAKPPCGPEASSCCCGCDQDPCKQSCLIMVPCVGPRLHQKKLRKQCEDEYDAQVQLAAARLAAEQYQLACAKKRLQTACELADGVCSEALVAEVHDVAALIHLAQANYLCAASHLDREAYHLRLAGNYREIPNVLELASAAYTEAARTDLAARRLCRVARIWFGRGDYQKSWDYLQQALPMAETSYDRPTCIQLALLAHRIEQVLSADGKSTSQWDSPAMISDTADAEPLGDDLNLVDSSTTNTQAAESQDTERVDDASVETVPMQQPSQPKAEILDPRDPLPPSSDATLELPIDEATDGASGHSVHWAEPIGIDSL